MNRSDRNFASYLMFVLLLGILALWGCPKKTEVTATPEPQREETQAPAQAQDQAPADQAEKPKPQNEEPKERAAAADTGMQPVYFDFDRSVIRADAKDILKANAEWLKANPKARVRIEGNCDERGTIEYNQALGQRRAANAKKFLTDLGISASRISLISYGKEKPGCTDSSEDCWQKNRRDDFIVVAD